MDNHGIPLWFTLITIVHWSSFPFWLRWQHVMPHFQWESWFSRPLIKNLKKHSGCEWLNSGVGDMGNAFCGNVGDSFCQKSYHFDLGLTTLSYMVGAIASIFAVWLTSRPTLPLASPDSWCRVLGIIGYALYRHGLLHDRNIINE